MLQNRELFLKKCLVTQRALIGPFFTNKIIVAKELNIKKYFHNFSCFAIGNICT